MKDYIPLAARSESKPDEQMYARMATYAREMHSCAGMGTESGELMDIFKRAVFYGAPVDKTNVKEELGDLCWYIAIMCDVYGWSFDDIMHSNIAKLKARYPEKFSSVAAINRDIEKERVELEAEPTRHL